MPNTEKIIRLNDCPSIETLKSTLEDDISSCIDEARTQAQDASSEASSLSADLPRDLCDGICDILDTLEGHADESVSQIDTIYSECQSLESELATLEEVLFQQLGKLKEIVDVGERDNAITLIDGLMKQVCPSLVE